MARRRRTEEEVDHSDLTLYEIRAITVRGAEGILRRGHLVRRTDVGRDLDLYLAAGCVVRTNLRFEVASPQLPVTEDDVNPCANTAAAT